VQKAEVPGRRCATPGRPGDDPSRLVNTVVWAVRRRSRPIPTTSARSPTTGRSSGTFRPTRRCSPGSARRCRASTSRWASASVSSSCCWAWPS
jgi:hypothetical protein